MKQLPVLLAKLNAKSSTEAELIGIDDELPNFYGQDLFLNNRVTALSKTHSFRITKEQLLWRKNVKVHTKCKKVPGNFEVHTLNYKFD